MKTNKIIEEMAKLIADRGLHRLIPRLKDELKKVYGVDGMYFWKDSNGWVYCDENGPSKIGRLNNIIRNYGRLLNLEELAEHLHGLSTGTCMVIYNKKSIDNLDEIKQFVLIKKLSGIK